MCGILKFVLLDAQLKNHSNSLSTATLMNLRKIFLLFSLMIALVACSSDDPDADRSIHGRWFVTEVFVDDEFVMATGTCFRDTWFQFDPDGTYTSYNSCDQDSYAGSYVESNNEITANMGAFTTTYLLTGRQGNEMSFIYFQGRQTVSMRARRR